MLNDLLKYLGIDPEKAKDIDQFKTEFTSNYWNKKSFDDQTSAEFRELFPKMIGKFTGKSTARIQSKLKSLGIELKDDEIKDKEFEDVIEIGIGKLHSSLDTQVKALQADGAKNTDQRVKDLEDLNSKHKIKIDDLTGMLKTTKETLDQKELSFVSEKKSWGLNQKKSDLFKAIKFSDEVKKKPLLQKGFLSSVEELFSFDIDEKGVFVVHDKASGKLIPNKAKNGDFLSPEDAVNEYAQKENVFEVNPHSGKTKSAAESAHLQNVNHLGTFAQPQTGGRLRKVSGSISED